MGRFRPGRRTWFYLSINGVPSGPTVHREPSTIYCAVSIHRPIDADDYTIGAPITFALLSTVSPSGADPSVEVAFTTHVVKK